VTQAHEPIRKSTDRPSAPKNVVNLMDALRRSIANDDSKSPKTKEAKAKKRVAGQSEMLMPIAGSGKDKAVKAPPEKTAAKRKAS
jgi:DNA end-binding protein Ku